MGNHITDYVFASARVRSVEKTMLSREKAEKMIDSRTPQEALKILHELGYGSEESKESIAFDGILSREIQKAYDFIFGIAPDKEMFNVFLYPYEYHNLKVFFKAEFLGIDPQPFLIPIGIISVQGMETMVRERSFAGMPEEMARAAVEVIDAFARTSDPQLVDLILDQACYASMKRAAQQTENTFIKGYVELLIDTANLKSFVRIRQMQKSWDFFSKIFLPGGKIGEKTFITGYDENYQQFAQRLIACGLAEVLETGAEQLTKDGRFTLLEKLCDDRVTEYAKQAKYISFGVEPLAAYLIAKEGDVRNARIIMAGLMQGLSREMIRERQRESYV